MNDKISIIMPAHNSEKCIEKAIKSVLAQTYKNFELIIVNNGSKDNTKEICSKYLNSNIKYFEIDISNVSIARNYGIEKSEGKFIAFLDSDDEYRDSFLQEMINNMNSTNCDLVTCGFLEINSNNNKMLNENIANKILETINKKEYLEILKENYLFNEVWNKIFRTAIIKQNNIKFDDSFDLGEDFLFVLDYLKSINKMSYINGCLYKYNDNLDGLNLKYRKDKFEIEIILTKKLEDFYRDNSFDMCYIYNRYGRIYYNGLLNIYSKNNLVSSKEKDELLKSFLKENINEFLFLKDKVTDKKFSFLINKVLLKGFLKTKIFTNLVILKKRIFN